MKKDWQKVQQQSQRMAEKGATMEERLNDLGGSLKSASAKTSELLSGWKERTKDSVDSATSKMNQATEENEALKKAREAFTSAKDKTAESSAGVFGKGKDAFATVMDKSAQVFDFIGD